MSPFQLLFVVFLLVPLVEIWLLIQVGGVIGAGWTIFLVVLTAVLGATLVRAQGLSTYGRIQAMLARGQMPALEMLEGLALFLAGALLLTPGFFTDGVGFVLLVPKLRRGIIRALLARGLLQPVHGHRTGGRERPEPRRRQPLEGDWRRDDD